MEREIIIVCKPVSKRMSENYLSEGIFPPIDDRLDYSTNVWVSKEKQKLIDDLPPYRIRRWLRDTLATDRVLTTDQIATYGLGEDKSLLRDTIDATWYTKREFRPFHSSSRKVTMTFHSNDPRNLRSTSLHLAHLAGLAEYRLAEKIEEKDWWLLPRNIYTHPSQPEAKFRVDAGYREIFRNGVRMVAVFYDRGTASHMELERKLRLISNHFQSARLIIPHFGLKHYSIRPRKNGRLEFIKQLARDLGKQNVIDLQFHTAKLWNRNEHLHEFHYMELIGDDEFRVSYDKPIWL